AIITKAAKILKQEIMARDGRVVFRPDSGIPEHIIAGYYIESFADWQTLQVSGVSVLTEVIYLEDRDKYYDITGDRTINASIQPYYEMPRYQAIGAIACLWDIFGGEVNSKGYKVLDTHVGLIYGDSITVARAKDIFERLKDKGFASSNIVFGVGSYTTQYTTRDSLGMAVKATGAVIDGQQIMVVKEPKTDLGKKSAKGFLKVIRDENGELKLVDNCQLEDVQSDDNELRRVFYNGKLIVDEDLTTIRERAASQL
ncbi:MAG: nicotinate phosphoribosyltransferase, partial [Actinobacteria bacterium]|nr:nicotinate phosphoribosyltransferase [Actinomycetota bacterium]